MQPSNLLRSSLGIILVTGGLLLLGWVAYNWLSPAPAPYQYELETTGNAEQFPELELQDWPDLTISKYQVLVTDIDKPVAHATLAQRGDDLPVLINWQSYTSELIIGIDQKPSELPGLATAISKHASDDALILAWWDTSRQINLLTGIDTLFTEHLSEPQIIPEHWQDQSDAIRNYENKFWQNSANQQQQFQQFADALSANAEQGVKQLRQLVGSEREAYLIVHVNDLYKLGLMRPEKIGITYQNFPLTGNMHGLINHMKVVVKENDFETYTLQSLNDQEIRVYFLNDEASSHTLMAQLFPFTDKTPPLELRVIELIYQHGGYWVFKIPA
jgi:hydroxylamine oxidation protein HaoB